MKYKFYYGEKPKFTDADLDNYSSDSYECRDMMKDSKGKPVLILENSQAKTPIWKVIYGFSTVVFSTYDEVKAFCKGRFSK